MDQRSDIEITLDYTPRVNYSLYHNFVPIIRSLSFTNHTPDTLHSLRLRISMEVFADQVYETVLPSLASGETVSIADANRALTLNQEKLFTLTEAYDGLFYIQVIQVEETTTTDTPERVIREESIPLSVLPCDYWLGTTLMPTTLAAFVTPNTPTLTPIIRRASDLMRSWTGDGAMDAYQSGDPDRVKKMMGALFMAISELGIEYRTCPPSFEKTGQRVRLFRKVLEEKFANCLDFSLLYASCLEAIGLNALVLMYEGHATAGAWLTDYTSPNAVIDDRSFLLKQIALGETPPLFIEATAMRRESGISFDESIRIQDYQLREGLVYECCIDITRCRMTNIRPLPEQFTPGKGGPHDTETVRTTTDTSAPSAYKATPQITTTPTDDRGSTRQDLWERKLLDLSLRNALLNTRFTKNMLPLLSANLAEIEDLLFDQTDFKIEPRPEEWDNTLQDFGLFSTLTHQSPQAKFVSSEIKYRRLHTPFTTAEHTKRLKTLYRSTKLGIEENGASNLYMALGFLKWYETPSARTERYAPILLIPTQLTRRSVAEGYTLSASNEETQINITLLEKLKKDFGLVIQGLNPLPEDDHGIDVAMVFQIIRKAVMNLKGWDVVEEAVLGIFSFSRFVMWNDLHNNVDILSRHPIVSGLIRGEGLPQLNEEDEELTDDACDPQELALPVNADAYQSKAVLAAAQGRSFILHGPPGTGKSQTITNIIANALYHGKKVLFVASKMAALSVVQTRLEKIGLAPFCLELFSNKATKKSVLDQIRTTVELPAYSSKVDYRAEAEKLSALRGTLAEYVRQLHTKQSIGLSLYELISRYDQLKDSAADERFLLDKQQVDALTRERLEQLEQLLQRVENILELCTPLSTHPLSGFHLTTYSPVMKLTIEQDALALSKSVCELEQAMQAFCRTYMGGTMPKSREELDGYIKIAETLAGDQPIMRELFSPSCYTSRPLLEDMAKRSGEYQLQKEALLQSMHPTILDQDPSALRAEWLEIQEKWFIPRFFSKKAFLRVLNRHVKEQKISEDRVEELLSTLQALRDTGRTLEHGMQQLATLFPTPQPAHQVDWGTFADTYYRSKGLKVALQQIYSDGATADTVGQALATKIASGGVTPADLTALHTLLQKHQAATERYHRLTTSITITATPRETSQDYLSALHGQLQKLLHHTDALQNWAKWCDARAVLGHQGYGKLIEALEQDRMTYRQFGPSILRAIFGTIILYLISDNRDLANFNGQLFEKEIERYRAFNKDFQEYTKSEVFAKLASDIPNLSMETNNASEIGILSRALVSGGRGLSLRRLFDRLPNLLPRIKPCMLMSPLSVAQYIDPTSVQYDIVIFDEASQLPTSEAVGAIARGKSLIVVGDPKQMPPTSFFQSSSTDVEEEAIDDLESILDDCLALPLPSLHLLCHYRSRHESLIAFSNAMYYDSKLITFPSPDNRYSQVHLHHIEGTYDRGKTRTNPQEANAVVAAIRRHYTDPATSGKSLGVVTFNTQQQQLIDDLITELFAQDKELEKRAMDVPEPLFIKNLENVQGDERDVIYFSVGFGPDQEGNVSHNFGPLNQSGGWRRLNVAVTRARCRMEVFSTMKPQDIDLSRTAAEGVAGLKAFLVRTARQPHPEQ